MADEFISAFDCAASNGVATPTAFAVVDAMFVIRKITNQIVAIFLILGRATFHPLQASYHQDCVIVEKSGFRRLQPLLAFALAEMQLGEA